MDRFKSLCVNKLITGVICAPYNYLPVKHPAHSLTFLFYYYVVFFHLFLSHEFGMALWKIKAKIIPRSTDFANWSCHWALQMVLSQQQVMGQEAPYNLTRSFPIMNQCRPLCSPGRTQTASEVCNCICSISAQLTWCVGRLTGIAGFLEKALSLSELKYKWPYVLCIAFNMELSVL